MRVEHGGVERAERPVASAARVVADEDVEMAERRHGRVDEAFGRVGLAEVQPEVVNGGVFGEDVTDTVDHRLDPAGIGTPGLLDVMRNVVVEEHPGPEPGQPPRDREPDTGPAADPGDERDPAAQRPGRDGPGSAHARQPRRAGEE
ncbi:hypothetical protein Airi02_019550 [Actinoallomurus iriomotensis]|uniref:Uncharacterized protein n=1 Tax=Actinoallomurus iriomotensis TaxID=478107 RepID=A0A9W6RWK7_9ACTN|nr:hypothetical protein Airi02_019550 [Actinoallomurus iriomotensis]